MGGVPMDAKQAIQHGLGSTTRSAEKTISGLTPEELEWHPRPDANSIGLILFHMARSEDSFVQRMLQQKSQIWETGKWYERLHKEAADRGSHYTAEQVASFRVPELKDLQEYTTAVRQTTLEYLNGLTADDLDRKVDVPFLSAPTVGSMLMLVVTHLSQHAGDISYLRGLKRGMDK